MLLCFFATSGPKSGAIENARRAAGGPAPNREAKRLVRNPVGEFGPAIRRCSPSRRIRAVIAPDRKRPEHARRSYLAALRTADGQSMTKGTTIATAFAAARFSRVPGVEWLAA